MASSQACLVMLWMAASAAFSSTTIALAFSPETHVSTESMLAPRSPIIPPRHYRREQRVLDTNIFTSPIFLYATKQSEVEDVVQPLKPKSTASKERREAVRRSMQRQTLHASLAGVDPTVLELLSEEFFYPTVAKWSDQSDSAFRSSRLHTRPLHRPEMVPGAMTRSTMVRYKHKRDLLNHLVDQAASSSASPVSATESSPLDEGMLREQLTPSLHIPSREVEWREKRHNSLGCDIVEPNGAAVTIATELPSAAAEAHNYDPSSKKKAAHGPKKKNLPKSKQQAESGIAELSYSEFTSTRSSNRNTNNLELRKYYATPLLTPLEEFALGQQVQFMVQCGQVHEGLAIQLMRLPTIAEWAAACGYTDPQADFGIRENIERQLRPLGAESMFKKSNPNMFVGNGLAHTLGVGRGRGRAKKPPPTKLRDVYQLDRETGKKVSKTPINRGTPSGFVESLLEARKSKQLMIQSNMRLVVSIARKYSKSGVGDLQDLVQEGSLGLSRAAEKYDPTKGFKFSTYASWWIQQAIFRSIAYHSRIIRLPVHIHIMLNRIRKVRKSLQLGLGRAPSDAEIADAMNMTPSKYRRMIRLTKTAISLELPNYKQNPKDAGFEGNDSIGDMASRTDFIGTFDAENVSPERSVDHSLFQDDLQEMLKVLSENERMIIRLRYGLEDGLTRTVTAVSAHVKRTPAWVRSVESKALRKLRRPWYEKKLLEHQKALTS